MLTQKWLLINWENPGLFKVLKSKNEITKEMLRAIDNNEIDLIEVTAPAQPVPPGGLGDITVARVNVVEVEDEVGEDEEESAHLEYGGATIL